MAREPMIFVNLPVSDLARSRRFLEAIGATNEPKFTDETAAMMRFSEAINVMLLTKEKFAGFTPREVADATATSEVLIALSADSRQAVDATIDAAVAAGGSADPGPKQDYGVMYGRSVADPDGHIWEFVWMDQSAAEAGAEAIDTAVPQEA
ncbi:MAG: VOC family protein [Sphingomicrobium sp.]